MPFRDRDDAPEKAKSKGDRWIDRTLNAYYADIHSNDLLVPDIEKELFLRYRTCAKCKHKFEGATQELPACPKCKTKRDVSARDQIVQGALLFVVGVAKGYARRVKGRNYDPELLKSLVSAGNWGLLIAVEKFQIAKQTRFLTYAAWWVQERIRHELDSMGLIRVPVYRQKAIRAKRKEGTPLKADPAYVVLEGLDDVDELRNEDQLEQNLIRRYGTNVIQQALTDLNFRGRDKYIALAYFGYRTEPHNLRQISKFLELSSERVRQIKKVVLSRLKNHLKSQNLHVTEDILSI